MFIAVAAVPPQMMAWPSLVAIGAPVHRWGAAVAASNEGVPVVEGKDRRIVLVTAGAADENVSA